MADNNGGAGDDGDRERVRQLAAGPLKRRRQRTDPFWSHFTVLERAEDGHTHQCKLCSEQIEMKRNKAGSFVITRARRHLEAKHFAELEAIDEAKKKKKKTASSGHHNISG